MQDEFGTSCGGAEETPKNLDFSKKEGSGAKARVFQGKKVDLDEQFGGGDDGARESIVAHAPHRPALDYRQFFIAQQRLTLRKPRNLRHYCCLSQSVSSATSKSSSVVPLAASI